MLHESGENYLEAILQLEKSNPKVRSIDIATALGVSKPSVSRAMGVLKKAGYINRQTYGDIRLTEEGRQKAMEVYQRHLIITSFLVEVLGIDPITAEEDACRVEHVVSTQTIQKFQAFREAYTQGLPTQNLESTQLMDTV